MTSTLVNPEPPSPALRGQNLVKSFGAVRAVNGVSLDVRHGEVVALIGPNGAGKSTLLSLLAGLLEPDEGTATIEGLTAAIAGGVARRNLGFVSGDTQLYGRLTPREVLELFGALHGVTAKDLGHRVDVVLDELAILSFADRRCDQLSSGQSQRVNLGRALVHDPSLLILDEPTTALDVASQRFVLEAVERARAAGRAVLFSSHVLGDVERVADRVSVLAHGRVIAEGPLDVLLEQAGPLGLSAFFDDDDAALGGARGPSAALPSVASESERVP